MVERGWGVVVGDEGGLWVEVGWSGWGMERLERGWRAGDGEGERVGSGEEMGMWASPLTTWVVLVSWEISFFREGWLKMGRE